MKNQMKARNRSNINTAEYWDRQYKTHERSGWYNGDKSWPQSSIRYFFENEIKQVIAEVDSPTFLEVGGGTGLDAEKMRKRFPQLECWNLDISPEAIRIGKQKYPEIKQICHELREDVGSLELNGYFDIIMCQEVIEHLPNPIDGIAHILSLLKPGGWIWFNFPHGSVGGPEHLWMFDYRDIPKLFFSYVDEVTICDFHPRFEESLHYGVKFKKK